MTIAFKTKDKNGKIVHLSNERLKHIQRHPYMDDPLENIKITLNEPTTIINSEEDKSIKYFYKEFKNRDKFERYLFVSVKYLNNHGFIITSFFTNRIA
ncbi:hypothetical protein COU57_05670 [Candidatus Pacearchaeota archaeon CG10_big_fil_rev_8_21_14_0_10_32_14]|nr:MAG: hypothetical protein COU57_05670 [Candidatus Pacearchaeota archaeon CG10_big_fil_rev_8_21_14_0_10_32_14]